MTKKYERATDEHTTVMRQALERWHSTRGLGGIGLGLLLISDGSGRRCLEHRGYPAAAVTRKVPGWLRALSGFSTAIVLDVVAWDALDAPGRLALLDHELTHIEVSLDDDGEPAIAFRPHDFYQGGFYEVAQRHGPAAPEAVTLRAQLVEDPRGQFLLPGLEMHDTATGEIVTRSPPEFDGLSEETAAKILAIVAPGPV